MNVLWSPQPKQEKALSCPAFELFFGGAAGGGKTDFLLVDFLDGINSGSGHRGILFRKTYPELEEIIARSMELYIPLGGEYNETKRVWTFPRGSTLKFRFLEKDSDALKYQGHQYTWIGFDELTNWASAFCYFYLFSRCRSAKGLPCRIRSTGNPGGVGHVWVKNRFINDRIPNRIYTDRSTGLTVCFIPSLLDDNLMLMQKDPDYEKRLMVLPPHLRRALRYGDWDIFAGQVFEEFRREAHVIKPHPLDPSWIKIASLDWGYARPFSIGWWAIDGDGRMVRYREMYGCKSDELNVGIRAAATDIAKKAWEISLVEGCSIMVADPSLWSKIDDSMSIAEKFALAGWRMEKGMNERISGLNAVHDLMKVKGEDGRPMLLVFNTCFAFIRTIPELVADRDRPEDVDTTGEDHVYDETRYAVTSRYAYNPQRFIRYRRKGEPDMVRLNSSDGMKYDPFRNW